MERKDQKRAKCVEGVLERRLAKMRVSLVLYVVIAAPPQRIVFGPVVPRLEIKAVTRNEYLDRG